MPHINDIPLERWPKGWLKLQVASLMGSPDYLLMHDAEKRKAKLPVSDEEMRSYIRSCKEGPNEDQRHDQADNPAPE